MSGATAGAVRRVLRLEGLCVLIAASIAYSRFGLGWGTFALFFLTPDISLLGYLAGPQAGAVSYNLAHSYRTHTLGRSAAWLSASLFPSPPSSAPASSGAPTLALTVPLATDSSIRRVLVLLTWVASAAWLLFYPPPHQSCRFEARAVRLFPIPMGSRRTPPRGSRRRKHRGALAPCRTHCWHC